MHIYIYVYMYRIFLGSLSPKEALETTAARCLEETYQAKSQQQAYLKWPCKARSIASAREPFETSNGFLFCGIAEGHIRTRRLRQQILSTIGILIFRHPVLTQIWNPSALTPPPPPRPAPAKPQQRPACVPSSRLVLLGASS